MWNLKNTTYVNNTKKRSRLRCREQMSGYQCGEGNWSIRGCMHAQTLCHLTLCNPMDYSLPGCFVHGISQTRVLERVAISSSRGSSPSRD